MEAGQTVGGGVRWRVPMVGRDPREGHRASTPLELLFDLCFVVAVAQAGIELHHALATGDFAHGLFAYLIVFFTIWWPWMNFTWFASAYDTDDVPYRLLTFVQIAGVLVVAAWVPHVFEGFDFSIGVVGYVIMRTASVLQWLRAAREDPVGRPVATRFAIGVGLVQLLWVVRLAVGGVVAWALLFLFGALELLIPVLAERGGRPTPWHPGHITERYGLFTIIVLGECILAATTAVQAGLSATGASLSLICVALGGLLIVLSLWWAYFKQPTVIGHDQPFRVQVAWGYGHFVIFAAGAAVGAGLQLAVDATQDVAHVAPVIAALSVAVPAGIFLFASAVLHRRAAVRREVAMLLVTGILLSAASLSAAVVGVPLAVLAMGVIVSGLVARAVIRVANAAPAV